MHIIPDLGPSLAMTLPFIVAFVGLWFILWNPLMAFLDDREKATDGARDEALALSEEADARASELETRLAKAHADLLDLHAGARTRAQAKEAEILVAARKEAETKIDAANTRIATEKESARAELETTAKSLSSDIVATLLA